MYKFLYNYVKPSHDEKAKLCYMDTKNSKSENKKGKRQKKRMS